MLFSDLSGELHDFLQNLKFGIFLENYHKIIWTAIIQSSHLVKAKDFKTGKILTEKLWKQIIWSIFFLVNYECDIA